MPTPPYVEPALPDPRKRTGLLGGLQSFGGLLGRGLKAAGRNFDRNAIGGIDAAMGPGEFTDDMRRSARANAVMSIGQMLATQGRTPIQEGLQQGQQRILGGWKMGRDRREQDAAKAAMRSWGDQMAGGGQDTSQAPAGGPGASQAPADPLQAMVAEQTRNQRMFQQMAVDGARAGNAKMYEQGMKGYNAATEQLRGALAEIRQSKPTFSKSEVVQGPDGKPLMTIIMSDGSRTTDPKYGPVEELMEIDDGRTKRWVRKNDPRLLETNLHKQIDPSTQATLQQGSRQFSERMDQELDQARKSLGLQWFNANTSRMNANSAKTEADAKAADREIEKTVGKPMSAEGAMKLQQSMSANEGLKRLKQMYKDHGWKQGVAINFGNDQEAKRLVDSVALTLARMESGAAIGDEELPRYAADVAQWRDMFGTNPTVESIDRWIDRTDLTAQTLDPTGVHRKKWGASRSTPAPALTDTDKALGFKPKK